MIKHEEPVSIAPRRGRVKWFHDKKGWGFLEDPHLPGDIFVHFSSIESQGYRSLKEGDEVEFELDPAPPSPGALRARKVRKISRDRALLLDSLEPDPDQINSMQSP